MFRDFAKLHEALYAFHDGSRSMAVGPLDDTEAVAAVNFACAVAGEAKREVKAARPVAEAVRRVERDQQDFASGSLDGGVMWTQLRHECYADCSAKVAGEDDQRSIGRQIAEANS